MALILSNSGANAFELVHTETKVTDPAYPGSFEQFNLDAGDYVFSLQFPTVVTGMTITVNGATLIECGNRVNVPYMGMYKVTTSGPITVSWSSSAPVAGNQNFVLNVYAG
jgi:hypothetical protein